MINGGMSNYLEDKLAKHSLGIASFTMPATLYIGLTSDIPTDSGGAELAASNYSRVACVFETVANGVGRNVSAVTFPVPSGTWLEAKGIIVADASSAGNTLFQGELIGSPQQVESINTGTDTITITAHGLADNTVVMMKNEGGALPTGLSATTKYYVINSAANTFKLSLTEGGGAVDITADGTGINRVFKNYYQTANTTSQIVIPANLLLITLD